MNVIRMEKLFPDPPEGRNENKPISRDTFAMPTVRINRRFGDVPAKLRPALTTSTSSNWLNSRNKSSTTQTRSRKVGVQSSLSSFFPSSSIKLRTGSAKRGSRTAASAGPTTSVTDASSIVLAVTTGRGDARAEVGMAAIDLRYPYLVLCQISDCQTYENSLSKIYLLDPMEVLMPNTMCEGIARRHALYRSIREKFPGVDVTPVSRVHFNEATGLERVKTLCVKDYSSVELIVRQKYYALSAVAALLKYVEFVQHTVYAPKSLKIEFHGSPNATVIDLESAQSLELVQSQTGERKFSLLGILDRCSTPMGRRLLRASILQPPSDESHILRRQSSVAELVTNRSLRALLQAVVRRFHGADRLLTLSTIAIQEGDNVQSAERKLNYTLLLKNSLDNVPELRTILGDITNETSFFQTVRKNLENEQFQLMRDQILETIHPDARYVLGYTSSNMQRCFAIKAGISDLLDIARRTYCELIDDMKTLVENLAKNYKLPLSLGCNATLGYHIQAILPREANAVNITDLPAEFIEVRKKGRTFTMTTNDLLILSQQCKVACDELHLMSNVLLRDMLGSMMEHIGCLFQLSADVAELDLIISLAQLSSLPHYVRPSFGPMMELKNSTHPVLEIVLDRPVTNDIKASVPRNFHTIMGPNMTGKSTYLKQIVLLQIMAQISCYVPAAKAKFRIADRIFCKISIRDDIESNASTFALEMKQAQYILRSISERSLIILDELCKGTAVDEGTSIAWGICERLLATTAFTFTATHYLYLTKLADMYHNVTNHHFETIGPQRTENVSDCRPTYTHRLKLGVAPTDDYGIALAELSGLPKDLTKKAREYAEKLLGSRPLSIHRNAEESKTSYEQSCYNLVADLYQKMEIDRLDRETLKRLVGRFLGTWDMAEESTETDTKIGTVQRVEQDESEVPGDFKMCTDNGEQRRYTENQEQGVYKESQEQRLFTGNVNSQTVSQNPVDCSIVHSVSHCSPVVGEQTAQRSAEVPNFGKPYTDSFKDNLDDTFEDVCFQRENISTAFSDSSMKNLNIQNKTKSSDFSMIFAKHYESSTSLWGSFNTFKSVPTQVISLSSPERVASDSLMTMNSEREKAGEFRSNWCEQESKSFTEALSTSENTIRSPIANSILSDSFTAGSLTQSQISKSPLHEYCLSSSDFEPFTLSYASTATEVAQANACEKEERIFREIETRRSLKEKGPLDEVQLPMYLDLDFTKD